MSAMHDMLYPTDIEHRVGDLFNAAQYELDLTMTARYQWHGKSQDAIGHKGCAPRAVSDLILPPPASRSRAVQI